MEGVGSVLVIDDEPVLQDVLGTLLRGAGFDYHAARTAAAGLQTLRDEEIDIVLLDLMLPDRSGLDLLPEIKTHDPQLPVVVITAYSSVESAIEAMRLGAFHYVPKPFKNEEVLHLVRRAAERRRLQVENLLLRSRLEGMGEIVGTSRRMQEVFELVRRAAPARSNILITGESGTGKELVARAIHRLSPRSSLPFVPVHTSAIPGDLLESTLFGHVKGAFTGAVSSRKGLFEAAHEGTLFLDEVGTINPETQTKLLRVIQEREIRRVGGVEARPVDVRLLAASNIDLWAAVQAGRFREDLYYRLNVITIDLPPLRERREDIPLLIAHFLRTYAEENQRDVVGFSPEAIDALTEYAWPGNVRELENAVERAVVMSRGETVELDELPQPLRTRPRADLAIGEIPPDGVDFRFVVDAFKAQLVRKALEQSGGVQRQAARLLQLSPTTLNEMVHRFGLADEPRRG
ncbi:MAG: sigma-54 dependent transcriptional regulator [Thermoanaerobaculales bacterium]|jgi:DNA-binding NtrC family response regulator|nr:sigma-54 dependent transcriptional regulator [Thermoanaerobaculales bacterium]